jgi:DMSO/TMAO reductase YedYZ molybdopterin-dependent catalytic subunit
LHVGLGLVLIPLVLAKLWSVIPQLFAWPPVRSIAHAAERVTLLLLVGSILFEIVTGVLNIQYDYAFGFSFYSAHYVGAWVFIGAFVSHVVVMLPRALRGARSRSLRTELRTPLAATVPEQDDGSGLVAEDPSPPTVSRRGALALVGGGMLLVGGLTLGQTVGDAVRGTAFLLPRGRTTAAADGGPNDFPVNKTFAASRIAPADVGADWRLELAGDGSRTLDLAELAALEQHTARLPLSCVEGWSTVQDWTGVRLRDLAVLAGVPEPVSAVVRSVEEGAQSALNPGQVLDPDSLLALRVNGADLSPDHGFPARIIVPALPAVKCTKWVRSIEFRSTEFGSA